MCFDKERSYTGNIKERSDEKNQEVKVIHHRREKSNCNNKKHVKKKRSLSEFKEKETR